MMYLDIQVWNYMILVGLRLIADDITQVIVGVVWHTGKVLACGTVGPRFNSQQSQGIL